MPGLMIDPRTRRPILPPNPALNPAIAAGTLTAPYNPAPTGPPITDPRQAQMEEQQLMNQAPQIDPTANVSQFPKAAEGEEIPDENLWSATGKTDDFGSWFNKRNSSDALTAFGAAMLKAPDFMTGLGDAALAVNQVDRDNRMPTPEEIARANIKARMASGKGAFSAKPLQQGYDSRGGNWTQILGPDGTPVWFGPNGVQSASPPEGFRDRANSGMGRDSNSSSDALTKDQDAAAAAPDSISRYEQMKRIAVTSGSGTGLYAGISRGLATLTGQNFGGTDLAQMQEFEKMSSTGELEAAISQKGLGQLTEGEREIIRRSVPTITTDPKAAAAIMDVFIARDKRLIAMQEDWEAEDLAPNQYKSWKRKWMADWDKEHGGLQKAAGAPGTEDKKEPQKEGKTSSGVSWKVE